MLNTVKVPPQFEPIFERAQEYVSRYFKDKLENPSRGTIEISGERYILVRAASMSVDFFGVVTSLYKDRGEAEAINVARQILFDIAHAIGKQDAKNFHLKMKLDDPIGKLSAGPVHFSYSGWAFVDIFPESRPSPDENYYLIYDHPFSFESDAWQKSGKIVDFPVCIMNAGYSSGWCEESFGVTLVASEILCKAKGDEACRFIMAHPSKIEGYIKEYTKKEPKLAKKISRYEVPSFFRTKQLEELLRKERDTAQKYLDVAGGMLVAINADDTVAMINKKGCDILGYGETEVIGKDWFDNFLPRRMKGEVKAVFAKLMKGQANEGEYYENPVLTKSGEEKVIAWCNTVLRDEGGSIIGTLSLGEDVTGRKKMEEALKDSAEEWQRTFDAIADLIFIFDVDAKILRANKAFLDAFKLKPEEAVGKKCYELVHKSKEFFENCPYVKTLKDKIPCTEEIYDPTIGMPLLVTTSPIFNEKGEMLGAVHTAKDIIGIKKAEKELQEKIRDLERFQKVAVGREMRMIELKKRLKELGKRMGEKGLNIEP